MYPTVSINKAEQLREALLVDREQTLERIYAKTYPMVLHFVKLQGGTADDAKDLLQEAVILLYEKLMAGNFTLTSAITTYLMGICKNLWRTQARAKSRFTSLTTEQVEGVAAPAKEESRLELNIMAYVDKLGTTCKNILVAFYYHNQRMDQIASQHKYSSTHTATVQKFKCLERLRKSLASFSINQFLN